MVLQAEASSTQSNMMWLAVQDHAVFWEESMLAGQEMELEVQVSGWFLKSL